MFSYKLNERQFQKSISQGQEVTKNTALLYEALNKMRQRDVSGFCPNCGVHHRKGVYQCENADFCKERAVFSENFLQTSHLHYTEMNSSKKDVFLLAKTLPYIRTVCTQHNTNIEQLFGVENDQIKALENCIYTL